MKNAQKNTNKKTNTKIFSTLVLLLTGMLLSVSSVVNAEPLWSNKNSGGDDFLLGTIHLGDERLSTLPQSIKDAINSVDVVIIETDMSLATPEKQQELLLKYALLPTGTTLKQKLSESVYKQTAQFFTENGMSIEQFMSFKPWMVALTMVQISYAKSGLNAENGVDKQVQAYALQQGKKVVGLESFAQQINFFNVIMEQNPDITNDDLILDTLKEITEFADLPQMMVSAWHKGDMAVFEKIYTDTLSASKFDIAAEKVLLSSRNKKWVEQLVPMLKQQKVLVAVGTLHFTGPNGLPKILPSEFELK
jgi:uncharacterized protein YbaP (TraB family)